MDIEKKITRAERTEIAREQRYVAEYVQRMAGDPSFETMVANARLRGNAEEVAETLRAAMYEEREKLRRVRPARKKKAVQQSSPEPWQPGTLLPGCDADGFPLLY